LSSVHHLSSLTQEHYYKQVRQTTYQTNHQYTKVTQASQDTMPSQRIIKAFKKAAKLTIFGPSVAAIHALPVAAVERYGWLSEKELHRGVRQQYEGPLHR
jgi:hypothetical protein